MNDEITTDDSFEIKINLSALRKDSKIGLTVIISDMYDNIIFGSINNHEENYYSQPMPLGDYISRCIIPSNYFNAGIFCLGIVLFGPNFTDALEVKNVLHFEIIDGSFVRKDFYGKYEGALRPNFKWETLRLDIYDEKSEIYSSQV